MAGREQHELLAAYGGNGLGRVRLRNVLVEDDGSIVVEFVVKMVCEEVMIGRIIPHVGIQKCK